MAPERGWEKVLRRSGGASGGLREGGAGGREYHKNTFSTGGIRESLQSLRPLRAASRLPYVKPILSKRLRSP